MQTGVGGTLRLGVGPTTAATAVAVIRAFCAQHPLAHVRLAEHLSAPELQRRLRGFELDAGIAYLSPGDQDGLDVLPLYEERYVPAASPDLLPAGATEISWADAAGLSLVLLTDRADAGAPGR